MGSVKTGNDYLMEPRDYSRVLQKNICDDYRKVDPEVLSRVNEQASGIVEKTRPVRAHGNTHRTGGISNI